MFEDCTPTCEAKGCDRALGPEPALYFRDSGGERRVYECVCGTVTVTVAKTHA